MLSKKLWLPALVAFSLSVPAVVRAQDMGGDEKKEEPEKKPEGGDKKPDEPKAPDAAKKTLAFDAAPASFKEGKGGGRERGFIRHVYELEPESGEQKAGVVVGYAGAKADYDKEKDRWVHNFEDKDGKKLDKSAVKEDSFEANGVKGKIAEVTGNFAPAARRGKKGEQGGDAKAPEKKWTKVINVFLEGPDGVWIVRIQGGEKTVEKYREDFMKYVKSVKVVDKK